MRADGTSYKKSSFGPAFLFLDKKRREALAAYYAFCRLMDDIADEPDVPEPQKELRFWREEISRVYAGEARTELGRELRKITSSFGMPADRFLLLIEGMEADLQGRRYKTFEELEWYLYRVAGIVGLATLDILGVKGARAEHLARTLGFAVQTTNIVRDVHEDASVGRVYLPADLLAECGLSYEDVLRGAPAEKLARALEILARRSEAFYRAADEAMQGLAWRKVTPCRVMECVYRANLAKIERTGFVFAHKIKLTRFEKIKNIIYALLNKLS